MKKKNVEHTTKHKLILINMRFTCKIEFRVHFREHIDAHVAFEVLRTQYDIENLITIDTIIQKICQTRMTNKNIVTIYVTHLKYHYNKILNVDQIIS